MKITKKPQISIQPIISYPKTAISGKSYVMSIDLSTTSTGENWPFDEEEYLIYCSVESRAFFSVKNLGEPVIVLHRFGGTYGPVTFLLTTNETTKPGNLKVQFFSISGLPIQELVFEDIEIKNPEGAVIPEDNELVEIGLRPPELELGDTQAIITENSIQNTPPRHFRIFLSSPSDVSEERERARNYITKELAKLDPFLNKITCEVVAWDDPHAQIPMLAGETPQVSVNNARPKPSECDIVIVILWSRMGSPLEINEKTYQSGTEWEYLDAIASPNKPPVLLYRRTESPKPPEFDINNSEKAQKQLQEFIAQNQKVQTFFNNLIDEKGVMQGGVNNYKDVEDFDKILRQHLPKLIAIILGEDAKWPYPPTYQSPPQGSRERYLSALRNHSLHIPSTVLGDETDFRKQVSLDQVFIHLEVTQKNLDDLNREDHWMRRGEGDPMLAVDAINKHDRVVLLGDPGSGKSSLVKHLVAGMAQHGDGLLPVFLVLRDLAPLLQQADARGGYEQRQTALANVIINHAVERAEVLQVKEFAEGIRQAMIGEQAFLVLDGLDEVAYEARGLVREAVGALLNRYNVPRVIITCRIRSYTGKAIFTGVPAYTLAPLKEELIASFVDRWYKAQYDLGRVEKVERAGRIEDLTQVVTSEPLLALARNPMLLTTMTIIHQQNAVLPKKRVKLYRKVVDLLLKRWQQGKGEVSEELGIFLDSREEKMRPIMERLAFEAHSPGDEAADLQRMETIDLLSEAHYLGNEGLSRQFLDYVDHRSGLLIGRGGTPERPTVYSFPHWTIQEYLAGSYLIGARGAVQRLQKLAGEGDFWSEAVLLGIEEQVYNSGSYGQNHVLNLASQLGRREPETEAENRLFLWASKMAEVVGADVVEQDPGDVEPGYESLARLRNRLVTVLQSTLPPIERVETGRTLARLGDPRIELLTLEAMPFSYVPAGPFLMGDEPTQINVPYNYWISQYPVTQAQYQLFVDAGGYENEQWWTDAGWKHLVEFEKRNEPVRYANSVYQLPNHPVVGVMWYEAIAYAKWLSNYAQSQGWIESGMNIRLPNELEWEKGARGGLEVPSEPFEVMLAMLSYPDSIAMESNMIPMRHYPWGEEITQNHCSYNETEIGTTSTPGCFPAGRSPYGLYDMSGNVLNWTRSKRGSSYAENNYEKWEGWEDLSGTDERVIRGGSFSGSVNEVRCTSRYDDPPFDIDSGLGFRLVVFPASK